MRWLAHGERDLPAALGWLSHHERAQLDTIRFTKRRGEYLTRRWTAKRAIATVLELDLVATTLASVEIRNRPSGAPYVEIAGRAAPVDVSLTDRAGWAVCLVGPPSDVVAGTLGVDLELVEPRTDGFVEDFFTDAERRYVRGLEPGEPRDEAANLIWSAKEAALKVRQEGLRADTRSVEVELDHNRRADGWAAMSVRAVDGTPMPGWWRRDGVFVLTIVFAAAGEPPDLLPGGAQLAAAEPTHSWVDHPLA